MQTWIKTKGYVTLMGVLLVSAMASTVALSLIFFSLSSAQISLTLQRAYSAKALANYCAEEALQEIRDSEDYEGNQTLNFTAETRCEFTVTPLGGESRQIQSEGQSHQAIARVKITTSALFPEIRISSWQEVEGF